MLRGTPPQASNDLFIEVAHNQLRHNAINDSTGGRYSMRNGICRVTTFRGDDDVNIDQLDAGFEYRRPWPGGAWATRVAAAAIPMNVPVTRRTGIICSILRWLARRG